MAFPLYEDTYLRRASAHQLYCFAIEVGFGANAYGAFGSVIKQRTEVVVEGTLAADPDNPKAIWEEYDFNCKPGALTKVGQAHDVCTFILSSRFLV